jgi:hypothetical protein
MGAWHAIRGGPFGDLLVKLEKPQKSAASGPCVGCESGPCVGCASEPPPLTRRRERVADYCRLHLCKPFVMVHSPNTTAFFNSVYSDHLPQRARSIDALS